MPLTRAQLISGDKTKGVVLSDQVQGVRRGPGVEIANDGTISFDPGTVSGVVKTNNELAKNNYVWPGGNPEDDTQLTYSSDLSALSWTPKPVFGLGLGVTNDKIVKLKVPTSSTTPVIGNGSEQAAQGSLYWDTDDEQLYIRVGGNWKVVASNTNINEALLSGSYTLYVNPEIGSDIYVTGTTVGGTPLQMVQAGYTPQKPFKTIARAALEVSRLQIALVGGGVNNSAAYDRFVIKCSAGEHIVDNAVGTALGSISEWVSGSEPDSVALRALNSVGYAGVILPRGVSIIGEDLRKTIIRPTYVPDRSGNIEDDRGSIFRITGGAFFFNFTFKDKVGLAQSHHLLDCFSFVSDESGDESSNKSLENYYEKTKKIFGQSSDNDAVNPGETEIVAPQGASPVSATDGVIGSSPYIFNCSIRSSYGLCGINADGQDVTGFKSMIVAQFTGTSIQKDMYCWQIYVDLDKEWKNITDYDPNGPTNDYNQYITGNPNSIRMNPDRASFHIRAINNAFIQEVSVFAIGQGIHHWVKNGGEVSITNSNSTFGGCAAIAEGYNSKAFSQDLHWNVARIKVASNLNNQRRTVSTTVLGVIAEGVENNATNLVLVDPLIESYIYQGVPEILASQGYTFAPGSYLWVENPQGQDWRAHLASAAWSPGLSNTIKVTEPMNSSDNKPPGGDMPSLAGRTVYIRRLQDTRTTEQRRYSFILNDTAGSSRNPLRDYVIQTTPGTVSPGGTTTVINDSHMTCVYKSGSLPPVETVRRAEIVLGRCNSSDEWAANYFYRPGDTVRRDNKHYTCIFQNSDSTFDPGKWDESYVHMPSNYHAYDYSKNVAPRVIFDGDSDGQVGTTTCGYDFDPNSLTYSWKINTKLINQYRSSTDYKGAREFLRGIGFTYADADDILLPNDPDNREINPSSDIPFVYTPTEPDRAATGKFNWPVEFRRPSTLRLFSHAWEWAGFLNYTKALPAFQKELSSQNQFTYYFTNKSGGRVYASGYNQEGLLVTAAGLTDLASGETVDVANLGNELAGIDVPGNNLENLSVKNLTIGETVTYGALENVQAKVHDLALPNDGFGIVTLASIAELTETENPEIAANDDGIDSVPHVVTIGGLNAWKIAQKIPSFAEGYLDIYVDVTKDDDRTTLEELLSDPPISPNKAVPTLQRAAQYANSVLVGSSRTARVKVAAGLYKLTSTWECNVELVAYGTNFSIPPFPSNSLGGSLVPNNYFDGSGYGDVSALPQFWAWNIFLAEEPSIFRVESRANPITFKKSATFTGGFHFLGMAKLIELLSGAGWDSPPSGRYANDFTKRNFIRSVNGYLDSYQNILDFDGSLDTLLGSLKLATRISASTFSSRTRSSAINFQGALPSESVLKDCTFGGVIPSHKDSGGVPESDPYVSVSSGASISLYNLYIRGVSKITSAGMSAGEGNATITSTLPISGEYPYGESPAQSAPWSWTQTHHTFISTPVGSTDPVQISDMGGNYRVNRGSGSQTFSYYEDLTGKLLPNHINLLNSTGGDSDNSSPDAWEEWGPFFDQFIHAKYSLKVDSAWLDNFTSDTDNAYGVTQGFIGQFGKSYYKNNDVKTRGVRLGSVDDKGPEDSYSILLGRRTVPTDDGGSETGFTIFRVAGITRDNVGTNTDRPNLNLGANPGEGNPPDPDTGLPLVTTGDNLFNLGLRSYKKGISSELCNIVRVNCVF